MENIRISTFKDFVGELKATYRRTELPTIKITNSEKVIEFIRPYFDECMDDHEEVKVLHLNRANQVVNVHHVSTGSDTASMVPIKSILQNAILIKTSGIILVHNHPSGNINPSKSDINISERLKKACEYLEISFLDSVIITRESHYSLANNGEL